MKQRQALLLYNDSSGKGKVDLEPGIALLQRAGIKVLRPPAADPGEFCERIKQFRAEVDRVIIGGGDGTLGAVAGVLLESHLPLGILPLGTANDLARSLQLPEAPLDACAVIAEGHHRPIDVGRVNDRYFFNVAHIGLGVRVTQAISSEIKNRWGPLSYARSVIDALTTNRPFYAEIACDDRTLRLRTIQIAVGNGRHYGGGMVIAEDAAIDDGWLDLYSLKSQRWWRLLLKAVAIKTGRLAHLYDTETVRAKAIAVATRRRLEVSADGEIVTYTPAQFRVIPSALNVYLAAAGRPT